MKRVRHSLKNSSKYLQPSMPAAHRDGNPGFRFEMPRVPTQFTEVTFVQCGLGMHQKDGMRGIQYIDQDLLLRIVVVEG